MHGYFEKNEEITVLIRVLDQFIARQLKCHCRFSVLWMQLKCIMITGFDIMGGIAEPIFYVHNTS